VIFVTTASSLDHSSVRSPIEPVAPILAMRGTALLANGLCLSPAWRLPPALHSCEGFTLAPGRPRIGGMATDTDELVIDSVDVLEQEDEDTAVVAWQLLMLGKLGFTLREAETIVTSRNSWHDAQALLSAGCSRELTALILT
jgi:hypothetical protein